MLPAIKLAPERARLNDRPVDILDTLFLAGWEVLALDARNIGVVAYS